MTRIPDPERINGMPLRLIDPFLSVDELFSVIVDAADYLADGGITTGQALTVATIRAAADQGRTAVA